MRSKYFKSSFLVLLLPSILLVSCTKLDFMLRWADTYFMSYVTDYFNLSSEEKTHVKSEFNLVLTDIRRSDFPVYAYHLNHFADTIDKGELNASTVTKFLAELENLSKKSLQKFEPLAQKTVAVQARQGFDRFDQKFADKQEDDFEKAEDLKKIAKESRKRMARWVSETIGFMTDEQERRFNDMILKHPAPMKLQLQSRQAVFDKFKATRNNPEARQKLVRSFFFEWESLQTSEYLAARKAHRERYINFMIGLSGELNARQKQNLVKNLRKRALELISLSER